MQYRAGWAGRSVAVEKDLIVLRAVTYGAVDDYGSLWAPGALSAGLDERLPVICWAHDQAAPIGRAKSWRDSPRGPLVVARIDASADVPLGRQALAQIRSGTITDCSVGFEYRSKRPPTAAERAQFPGVREVIERAFAGEISLVAIGAVPGAKVAIGGDAIPPERKATAAAVALSGSKARAEILSLARSGRISQREAERRLALEDQLDTALSKALRVSGPMAHAARSLEAEADQAIARALGRRS